MTVRIVPDLLRARAADHPGAVALRLDGDSDLTYSQWDRRSNAAARGLLAGGVQPGDRVGLAIGNDGWTDYAVAYMGVLKAGAAAVPLGDRFRDSERAGIVEHAGAALVIDDVASLEAGQPAAAVQVETRPDDLAEIIYTSGTTGSPKGVACTHSNLLAHDVPAGPAGPVSFLHAFPVGTQAAQEAMRVPLRIAGRCAIAMRTFAADAMCALVERFGVVRLQLVPAMAQVLLDSGALSRHDLSSVRRVILSSAPAPPTLFERLAVAFPNASLWNAYAVTEAGAARTMTEWDPSRPTSVGRPVGETEVRIVDGEVWLRRPGSPPRWYYDDAGASGDVFVDGWTRTGDLGAVDADGHLHLTGRAKDLIITGGANVSPVEVEHVLLEHRAVADAAVVGVPHPVLGEDVAAAVVLRSPTSDRELQELVRSRLAEHKVPHRIAFVDALPRNQSGKVLKRELRAQLAAAVDGERASREPAVHSDTEAAVASVWADVLARPAVGREDDFFALGGHSLAATQIVARLRESLDIDLPVAAVFDAPTVAELARAVERAKRARQGAAPPLRP